MARIPPGVSRNFQLNGCSVVTSCSSEGDWVVNKFVISKVVKKIAFSQSEGVLMTIIFVTNAFSFQGTPTLVENMIVGGLR